jgi:hypothetical protein
VAPAINFFRPHYARLAASLPEDAVRRLDQGEVHVWEDETGVTHLRKSFAERSARQELELAGGLGPGWRGPSGSCTGAGTPPCPTHTPSTCWRRCGASRCLPPPCPAPRQVELVLRREAEHRFVEPESLAVITESVDTLLDRL